MFLTLCHMTACATLGYILSATNMTPIKPLKSKKQLWKVCLLATIFCITIVLGNLSLKYIPVSFNQAIGATTPFFTAVFAVMLQGGTVHHTPALPSGGRRTMTAAVAMHSTGPQGGVWLRDGVEQQGERRCVAMQKSKLLTASLSDCGSSDLRPCGMPAWVSFHCMR